MASRPNLDLLPAKARHAASNSWQQTMGTPLSITERLCLAVTAALPHLEVIPVSALLSDEVVTATARALYLGRYPDQNWNLCNGKERGFWEVKARTALQAAIEQVGGGQGAE